MKKHSFYLVGQWYLQSHQSYHIVHTRSDSVNLSFGVAQSCLCTGPAVRACPTSFAMLFLFFLDPP